MQTGKTRLINKFLDLLLIGSSAFALCYLLYYHFGLIKFPWPIQYREGGILLSTELLLNAQNPYDFSFQPYYCNAYGLFYNLVVLPFAWLFGATLTVHKSVAGAFTLLSLVTVYILLKRQSVPLKYAIPTIAFLYSALLYSKTSLAEPDSTGAFILLLSIAIPIIMEFAPVSLAASILLSGVGFFTKPYFIFGMVAVSASLLYSRSWKKLFLYLSGFAGFILLELFILDRIFETYTINVLLSNYDTGKLASSWPWILDQLWFISSNDRYYFSAIILASLCYVISGMQRGLKSEGRYMVISLLTLCLIFIAFLGKNTGAFATYFYQLPFPFLCVVSAIAFAGVEGRWVSLPIKLLLIVAMISICRHYPAFYDSFRDNEKEWKRAEILVSSHKNILNSPAIAPLLIKMHLPVYDSGHTGVFFYGLKYPDLISKEKFSRGEEVENRFKDTMLKGVAEKKFDLIMIDRSFSHWLLPPVAIMDFYDYKGNLLLEMPHNNFTWQIDIWEPKP